VIWGLAEGVAFYFSFGEKRKVSKRKTILLQRFMFVEILTTRCDSSALFFQTIKQTWRFVILKRFEGVSGETFLKSFP